MSHEKGLNQQTTSNRVNYKRKREERENTSELQKLREENDRLSKDVEERSLRNCNLVVENKKLTDEILELKSKQQTSQEFSEFLSNTLRLSAKESEQRVDEIEMLRQKITKLEEQVKTLQEEKIVLSHEEEEISVSDFTFLSSKKIKKTDNDKSLEKIKEDKNPVKSFT